MSNSLVGALGAKYPDSTIIFDDDFHDGSTCGWNALMDSSTPRPAIGVTTQHSVTGPFSLRLGTGPVGNSAKDGFAAMYKRMTRLHDTGIVNYDIWWAWGATLAPSAPQDIEFGLDTQSRHGTKRNFFKFRWEIVNSIGATTHQWKVWNGAAYVNVPGAVYAHPYNENKQNFIYCRFSVDLGDSLYKELQVYDDVYDLTALGIDAAPSDATVNNFDGGLNFGAHLYNRGGASLCQAWLDIDRARGWYK
jgi:hypothetical protein